MNNRIAIIDLGTNTFHLLIVEIKDKKPSVIHLETIPASLGEGGMKDGNIKSSAFDRGLEALKQFRRQIELHQVNKVKALATSALRSASNGAKFIDQVLSDTGIQIELIDGNREAELIYSAVSAAINLGSHTSLIMDIGGGSVEFIICNQEQIFWKKSYDIGAARLMNQFHHSDPISKSDMEDLQAYLNTVLEDLKNEIQKFNPIQLIGSAGAFETYASLIDVHFKASFERPEFNIDLKEFEKIAQFIIESKQEERAKNPAIPEIRVNMIVIACLLTRYVLSLHPFQELKLSTYSMKEGVLFEMIKN
jgi:exopolyphosphatase/guanosine-5'-triphosphate,3'-diphosphate pyrophosphatase